MIWNPDEPGSGSFVSIGERQELSTSKHMSLAELTINYYIQVFYFICYVRSLPGHCYCMYTCTIFDTWALDPGCK